MSKKRRMNFYYESYVPEVIEELDGAKRDLLNTVGGLIVGIARILVRVDSGETRDSIEYAVVPEKSAVVVGSDKKEAIYNELGTRKMKKKSFLKSGANRSLKRIKQAAEGAFSFKSKRRRRWRR